MSFSVLEAVAIRASGNCVSAKRSACKPTYSPRSFFVKFRLPCKPWQPAMKHNRLHTLDELTCCSIDNFRVNGVRYDGGNTLLHGCDRRIHLTLADDFTVGGLQHEVGTAVFGGLAFEAGVIAGICFNGGDSLFGRALLGVAYRQLLIGVRKQIRRVFGCGRDVICF